MTPEEIARDKAIDAARTSGEWRQGIASGVHVADGDGWIAIAFPEDVPDGREDANGEAIVNAVNRLPAYIAETEEMNRRVAAILAEERVTRLRAQRYPERSTERAAQWAHADGLLEAANILRGGK